MIVNSGIKFPPFFQIHLVRLLAMLLGLTLCNLVVAGPYLHCFQGAILN
jgi:hypothetical protein